jgi:hypothetical protein
MVMAEILLPHNASQLEKDLDLTTGRRFDAMATNALSIAGIKYDPPDAWLPWLIWEYGLMEVLPYIKDYRRAIREGIQWQRIRGTPKSLEIALSWIGATPVIEQEEPGCVHWAEFQFDSGYVPLPADVDNLIAVARLSAPVRSRLSRIFHGYDLRRVKLDVSLLGDALLSDYSGRMHSDGVTKLSFGRKLEGLAEVGDISLQSATTFNRVGFVGYDDRCQMDWMFLDTCKPLPNPFILHSHLFAQSNGLGVFSPDRLHRRKFCKAELVLSDDGLQLCDANACTPGCVWDETGEQIRLSGSFLSDTPWRLVRVECTERRDDQHAYHWPVQQIPVVINSAQTCTSSALQLLNEQALGSFFLDNFKSVSKPFVCSKQATVSTSAAWTNQTWTAHRWPDVSWNDLREIVSSNHLSQ